MQNCVITRKRNYNGLFDMVLFVAEDNVSKHVKRMEKNRRPEQIYGIIIIEPPHIVGDLSYLDNKINWTVSYRSDADVKWVYGSVYDKETHLEMPKDPMWKRFSPKGVSPYVMQSDLPSIVANKTKMVAWFVSNCDQVQSRRMELAKEIGKYIPVDIYGKCGDLKCNKGDQKCSDMLEQDYKFYLSFENALCQDYVTEKAFRIMNRAIIPIVYNGADMSKLLPPKSYINAEDYETPKELADYLLFLANNPDEYLRFFWWKEHYKLSQLHYACYLCQKLNERDPKKEIVPYASLETWHKKDTCRSPRISIP